MPEGILTISNLRLQVELATERLIVSHESVAYPTRCDVVAPPWDAVVCFLQVLHFCYGLGAFVSPMIAEPFLLNEDCSVFIDNVTMPEGTNILDVLGPDESLDSLPAKTLADAQQMTKVRFAFWIMAVLMVRVGLLLHPAGSIRPARDPWRWCRSFSSRTSVAVTKFNNYYALVASRQLTIRWPYALFIAYSWRSSTSEVQLCMISRYFGWLDPAHRGIKSCCHPRKLF